MRQLETLARAIVNNSVGNVIEDRLEAYQFLVDNWMLDALTPLQLAELQHYIESGLVDTAPWRAK